MQIKSRAAIGKLIDTIETFVDSRAVDIAAIATGAGESKIMSREEWAETEDRIRVRLQQDLYAAICAVIEERVPSK